MLSADPCVACDSTIEPDNPSVEITNPLYAAATSQPKSIRTRLAASRASSAAVTRPRPQFNHDAIMPTKSVSDMADNGVVASEARFASPRCTPGDVARAYPATSMITILNAKVQIVTPQPYHPPLTLPLAPFSPHLHARPPPPQATN